MLVYCCTPCLRIKICCGEQQSYTCIKQTIQPKSEPRHTPTWSVSGWITDGLSYRIAYGYTASFQCGHAVEYRMLCKTGTNCLFRSWKQVQCNVAQRLFILTSIFVFVREYASSEAQDNLLWKYLYGRSPIERVVANSEDGFLGFHFLPIQEYND